MKFGNRRICICIPENFTNFNFGTMTKPLYLQNRLYPHRSKAKNCIMYMAYSTDILHSIIDLGRNYYSRLYVWQKEGTFSHIWLCQKVPTWQPCNFL